MPPLQNLNIASDLAIGTALSNLKSTFNVQNCWIRPPANKYIVNTIATIQADMAAGTINQAQLVDYIATSVLVHSFNGWSYLSSAIRSFLHGDYANAIHNAYYAELRGIMSFLNSQGIGVFNYQNLIVDLYGNIHPSSSKGTHIFAKEAFDQWLNYPANATKMLQMLTTNGNSLDQWFIATGFSPSTYMPAQLMSDWFKEWSLDLNVIKLERDFRNFVSYNPQSFDLSINRPSDNIKSRLEFISDLWKLCSPTNLFENSILRNSLEPLYNQLFGLPLSGLDIEKDWGRMFIDLGMDPKTLNNEYIIKFLRREVLPDDNLVFKYAKQIQPSQPLVESDVEPMGIIARACLVLLINAKIIENILRVNGIAKGDLKFWFDNIGFSYGYWDPSAPPYLFSDLWDDIKEEVEELDNWLNNPAAIFSPFKAQQMLKVKAFAIYHINKTYLWKVSA